jgi:hypothetical protein
MNALVTAATLPCLGSIVLAGLGWFLLVLGQRARRADQASHWPTGWGVVQSSRIREHIYYERETLIPHARYEPVIEYTYATEEQDRPVTLACYARTALSRAQAEEVAAEYPPGAQIAIHFNPEIPVEQIVGPEELRPSHLLTAGTALVLLSLLSVLIGIGILLLQVMKS